MRVTRTEARIADLQAQLTPNRLGHRDTTADTAIGNLTNNRRKRP